MNWQRRFPRKHLTLLATWLLCASCNVSLTPVRSTPATPTGASMPEGASPATTLGIAQQVPSSSPAEPSGDTPRQPATFQGPPPSGPSIDSPFPAVVWGTLPNGLRVATIANSSLPVVQLRLAVLSGKASEGMKPGVADLTAEFMKAAGAGTLNARELVSQVESMGSDLTVRTGFDSTVFGLAVTKRHTAEAMNVLGMLVALPRLRNKEEFDKLKQRELERVADSARTSGRWAASVVLFRELFGGQEPAHPYAHYDVTASEMSHLTAEDCRAHHRANFVPSNSFLVVAGDIRPDEALTLAEKAFRFYHGEGTRKAASVSLSPRTTRSITVIDRPKSSQSDLYVGILGPDRKSEAWPSFAVVNQILGGAFSGRLFADIREKQSLAYSARSSVVELGQGPTPLLAYAGTQTAKTGLAMRALLSNLDQLAGTAPSPPELATASQYLADVFAIQLETIGAIADELVHLRTLDLPDTYDDAYRKALREVSIEQAHQSGGLFLPSERAAIAVAGDAELIAPMLSHFGAVRVVDPKRDFAVVRVLPSNPEAPLELPRVEGR